MCAAVLQQSIGNDGNNREIFFEMFDQWHRRREGTNARPIRTSLGEPSAPNMFDQPFLYNVRAIS